MKYLTFTLPLTQPSWWWGITACRIPNTHTMVYGITADYLGKRLYRVRFSFCNLSPWAEKLLSRGINVYEEADVPEWFSKAVVEELTMEEAQDG